MHPTQSPAPPPPAYPPMYEAPPVAAAPAPLAMPAPVVDTRSRNAAIALVACAALVLIGVVARSWFTARGGSLGLLGIEECRGGRCMSLNWLDIERAPGEIKLFASVGLLAGLAAIGFAIQAAVVLFKGQPQRVLYKWLNGSLAMAAFGCVGFFFTVGFGELSRKLSFSWAGFFAIGGIIAASVIVASWVRPLMRAAGVTVR